MDWCRLLCIIIMFYTLLLCTCRAYVDLIDLTNELPSDQEESSDLDDIPLPEVSLSTTYDRYMNILIRMLDMLHHITHTYC